MGRRKREAWPVKYRILALEREYASGGREVADLLSSRLEIPRYGVEILELAAKEMGGTVEQLEQLEESATSSFLYSLYMMSHVATGSQKRAPADQLFYLETEIIRRLADAGPVILLGRCASHLLRDRKGLLRVFIRANMDYRCRRAEEIYGIAPTRVEQTLRKIDKRRESFYTANTGKKWRDPANYDLVLDGGSLGTARCAEILAAAME